MCAVYLDFRKAFNIASCSTLAVKLVKYGMEKYNTRWMDNQLLCGVQRVLISSAKSNWWFLLVAGYYWCS